MNLWRFINNNIFGTVSETVNFLKKFKLGTTDYNHLHS